MALHPLELFTHQIVQCFVFCFAEAGEIFAQMQQVIVGQIRIIALDIRAVGLDAVIEVMIRHDPAGAGILDGQQHPVGQCAQILAPQKIGRVVKRQTLRRLMVQRRMRGGDLRGVPVVRHEPAARFRRNVAGIRHLAEKADVAGDRLVEHALAELTHRRDVQLKKIGVEARVIEARPDAVIGLQPFAAWLRRPVAVAVLPLRHGVECDDDERPRFLAARHAGQEALDAVGRGAAVIIVRAGRDIIRGRFAVIAVKAPVGRAAFHIICPQLRTVVPVPVDHVEGPGYNQAVRHAPLGKPVAVHGQMEAVRRFCDVERAVHLRQVLSGVIFAQDERARQREEIRRAGIQLDHDDRRRVFPCGQRL